MLADQRGDPAIVRRNRRAGLSQFASHVCIVRQRPHVRTEDLGALQKGLQPDLKFVLQPRLSDPVFEFAEADQRHRQATGVPESSKQIAIPL